MRPRCQAGGAGVVLPVVDPDDTQPCPPPADTERCYNMPEPEHEPFGPVVRRVTFLPEPLSGYTQTEGDLFDLASEDLEDDQP